jgi:tryptophan-rich sensory protein
MQLPKYLKIIVGIVICQLAGVVGSIFTFPQTGSSLSGGAMVGSWYSTLNLPSINPPSWLFGPVWTTLFVLMGVAVGLVWTTYAKAAAGQEKNKIKIGLWLFVVQLVLNVLWSVIFFGWRNPGLAFFELLVLWLAILFTKIYFYQVSRTAAYLLLPYILWVSFAGYLNFSIWRLNINPTTQPVGCTLEAKICSDGSAVGRVGPDCEFERCPNQP